MTGSEAVEQYLASGEFDPRFPGWRGNAVQRARRGREQLRHVLLKVVAWRARHAPLRSPPAPPDVARQVRVRVAPMLQGLFPADEASVLLRQLPQRVLVVGAAELPAVAERVSLGTLWHLANMILDDLGAPPLSDDQPTLEGFCEEGHAWVLPRAFLRKPAEGRTEHLDPVVHEVAHLLHEVRRGALGLAPPRGLLLPVPLRRRETFAWTCELWDGLRQEGEDPGLLGERVAALAASGRRFDARVDRAHLLAMLQCAAAAPADGWQRIRQGIRKP